MKKNIAIVMGGFSGEYEISIGSGTEVYKALSKEKYNVYRIVITKPEWYYLSDENIKIPVDKNDFSICIGTERILFDLAFIIIHGNPGEDGRLQGYFDMIGLPYTTCGFYTSALTFHKGYCNAVVKNFDIVHLAKSKLLSRDQLMNSDVIVSELKLPVFVKPAAGGSSVGITKVKTKGELMPAIHKALQEDEQVLIEESIQGREFGCGMMKTKTEKIIFPVTEIIPIGREYFDYKAKYEGFSNEITPAEIPDSISDMIKNTASQLYDMFHCRGIVRFDFIYNEPEQKLYFLEVNTVPGQSSESIVPKQARAIGISTTELYDMLIESFL